MDLRNADWNAMIQGQLNLDNLTDDERNEYSEVLEKILSMNKARKMKLLREEIAKVHKYAINHTEKSGWFTRVKPTPEDPKEKIRLKNEEDFLLALAKHYNIEIEPQQQVTLSYLYEKWSTKKAKGWDPETTKRHHASWKAYYNSPQEPVSQELIHKPVAKITKIELCEWAEGLIMKHQPNEKKFNRMFTIVKNLYEFAEEYDIPIGDTTTWKKARKMIDSNLLKKSAKKETDFEDFENNYSLSETQVFTDEEVLFMQEKIRSDLKKYKSKPTSAGLQILFMLETALRIGEACGLKWRDIDFDNAMLHVRRQANNTTVKFPKTATSIRTIPLTAEAIKILEEVKAYNAENGFDKEWIFQSNNPKYDYRLSYNAADRKLRKLCKQMNKQLNPNTDKEPNLRSPHKLRKTTLSVLCDTINLKTAQAFAGHKDATTTQKYYCFDRDKKEIQYEKIREAISSTRTHQDIA